MRWPLQEPFARWIRESAAKASDRKQYRGVAKMLPHFANACGEAVAVALRDEIVAAYPWRPALREEMGKAFGGNALRGIPLGDGWRRKPQGKGIGGISHQGGHLLAGLAKCYACQSCTDAIQSRIGTRLGPKTNGYFGPFSHPEKTHGFNP